MIIQSARRIASVNRAVIPMELDRLILREFVLEDWPYVHAYAQDPAVVRFMNWGPNSEEETQSFVAKAVQAQELAQRKSYDLAIVRKDDNRLIGGCGLYVESAWQGSIGYCLHSDCWGSGYVPEAGSGLLRMGFHDLRLHRIYATCDVQNTQSARVMEKLGMKREAHLREHILLRGSWRDSYLYSILEHEWRAKLYGSDATTTT